MGYETRISYEGDLARVTTDDPEVIAELDAHPDARVVAEASGWTSYELAANALALHFPRLADARDS